jgi:rubrerythrin
MATITASWTAANLRYALATEILINRRYLAFAAQADVEGNHDAAALFRSIADSRSGQARRHLELLETSGDSGSDGDTAYNVRAAIMNEVHECADIYPGMVRQAREDGLDEIADWFEILAKASRSHAGRFRRAMETLM